jgi:hypothetical protein
VLWGIEQMPCRFLNCFDIQWLMKIERRVDHGGVSALKHLPFKRV